MEEKYTTGHLNSLEDAYKFLSSSEAFLICELVNVLKVQNKSIERLIDEAHESFTDYNIEIGLIESQRDEMLQILQYYAAREGQGHAKRFLDIYYAAWPSGSPT